MGPRTVALAAAARPLMACVVAALLLFARGARAQPAPRSVEVSIAAPDADAAALEEALRDPLHRLHVAAQFARIARVEPRAVIDPKPDAPPALARVWLDLERPGRATLYLVDGAWERILVRHVPLPRGLDEVAREELSLILRGAIEGLMAGARIGVSREEAAAELGPKPAPRPPAPRPRPAPAPAPPPAAGPILEVGVLYEAQVFSSEQLLTHGPIGSVAVRSARDGVQPGGWITGQFRVPFTVDGDPAGLELGTWALRALATLDGALAERLSLRGAFGGGVDIVDIEPRVNEDASARPAPARHEALGVLRAAAALERRLFGETALFVGASCELDLADNRYVVVRTGEDQVVLAPFRLRPALIVGITVAATAGASSGPR